MTEEQMKRLKEISRRWHNAEKADNRQIAQAVLDIGYLTGIIMLIEQELESEFNAHREDMERS